MGHSKEAKASTRQRILDVAAQRFREHGLSGIGLAEITREAGITPGAFYRHFSAREAMLAEVVHVAARSLDAWAAGSSDAPSAVRNYLNAPHRDAPGVGCPLVALVHDIAHADPATRDAYTIEVNRVLDFLEGLNEAEGHADARARALLQLSACVGAMGLSRAVSDPAYSQDLLDNVAEGLVQFSTPQR
ncbi:TetR/AcrR family transcriptional regulator [Cupriavidus sp. SIMBA_020]|uniref:TetR/AcrR family transcriptional regulator n=1 Tax=Cupriavidus sp. SIMBA_020 TaxID=3085766 RepID=UPI00397BFCB6